MQMCQFNVQTTNQIFKNLLYESNMRKSFNRRLNSQPVGSYFTLWLIILFIIVIFWKLWVIDSTIHSQTKLLKVLHMNKKKLELAREQLEQLLRSIPKIYAITPTYKRPVQKAQLTRISQTLQLVPYVHWIVVEDSTSKSALVRGVIAESRLFSTHLNVKSPTKRELKKLYGHCNAHKGLLQRNLAMAWLRNNLKLHEDTGVVYCMDDDNTYSIKVFSEMRKIKKVGIWPVGFIAKFAVEMPILDKKTGKVSGYYSGWDEPRDFAVDMAGFAINLDLILAKTNASFEYSVPRGFLETDFLSLFITREELEPLADNCTKVYVWHTRSLWPKVDVTVPGLEV